MRGACRAHSQHERVLAPGPARMAARGMTARGMTALLACMAALLAGPPPPALDDSPPSGGPHTHEAPRHPRLPPAAAAAGLPPSAVAASSARMPAWATRVGEGDRVGGGPQGETDICTHTAIPIHCPTHSLTHSHVPNQATPSHTPVPGQSPMRLPGRGAHQHAWAASGHSPPSWGSRGWQLHGELEEKLVGWYLRAISGRFQAPHLCLCLAWQPPIIIRADSELQAGGAGEGRGCREGAGEGWRGQEAPYVSQEGIRTQVHTHLCVGTICKPWTAGCLVVQ